MNQNGSIHHHGKWLRSSVYLTAIPFLNFVPAKEKFRDTKVREKHISNQELWSVVYRPNKLIKMNG